MTEKQFCIYILASKYRGTLYIGVTSNIIRRIFEHKNHLVEGFTNTYNVNRLVYFEVFSSIEEAIEREKQLKHWNRDWKIKLIERSNPYWKDLYNEIV
ncbi:hypothetical protein A3D77_01925 [Candidatus Gottesmanbacteria bacterium RIFCSPHIGHO2_02_FULL_39_11]|uniref:GIY-YIG domain-containing protein n=1 Tax=Candidatus Gottesmanbacteria bacterium RIFCSPHIGHO2_02_FULL_39_11 TaxID=1798382 RepID=A0A1F5ZV94_9BACT|nr:MAG: hypothetical protein A3D77_01925 [Candidatus Gottesmanbacteria bacterium RIFCSPHIGHO2_02_FULL_39_11]